MNLTPPASANYAAVVVELKQFVELANCDNVKAAIIFNNSVIVSKDAQAGDVGLFFPVETALSKEFIGNNNLYRKAEFGNVDPTKTGFFEESGRVKAMKFRGHKSEGFFIPISSLDYIFPDTVEAISIGNTFDKIGDHEICRKYISRRNKVQGPQNGVGRRARVEDQIRDGQFRLHYDTENMRRNAHKVMPDDWISVSVKLHGTSAVFGNVLVKRQVRWYERLLAKLGVCIQTEKYGLVWSSRRVIKGVDSQAKDNAVHFYTSDIWGTVAQEIGSKIPKGFTVYGEIVGFTPEGSPIQGGYHYGCGPKQHKLYVYRVTQTNEDGMVMELSWPQLTEFCGKFGFDMVPTLFCGRAGDWDRELSDALYDGGDVTAWQEEFLKTLESVFVGGGMCPFNNHEVPAEGVVVRIDRLHESEALKLKSFDFLTYESKALDKDTPDMEAEEEAAALEENNA